MFFEVLKKSKKSRARLGKITTPRGVIFTPAFIPVGTQATVKGLTPVQLNEIGAQAVLANTYHLYLRPGDKKIKKLGGLHKFMNWDKPIFTDSGGFQAFSLGAGIEHGVGKIASIFPEEGRDTGLIRANGGITKHHHERLTRITENGVEFRSHLDGSRHFFTPEKSMEIQRNLGADIIFAFDECTSPLHDYDYTKRSMERTHRWAIRCLAAKETSDKRQATRNQFLFGIIQGGASKDLREKSAKFIGAMDFEGIGIGGSLGKSKKEMHKILGWLAPLLPAEKPRHLLGIGSADDIIKAVKYGMDTFDCVEPTRIARNGEALMEKENLNLKSGRHFNDKNPIDKKCGCYACRNFCRAYLAHLFKAKEILGPVLATIHNLYFMERLMEKIRNEV